MAIVGIVLAVILMVAAWNSKVPGSRAWLFLWAAINLAGAFHMAATGFPYAWALMPPDPDPSPGYRR